MTHILFFNVPDEELIKRLLSRAEKEGRVDDNIDAIKNRLVVFKKNTQPLLDYYSDQGKLKNIEGTGDVNSISELVKESIGA